MSQLTTLELQQPTPVLTLYRRALLRGRHPGEKTLPPVAVTLRNQRADLARLELFNQACGFLTGRELPAVYPHILAFPLHMELLTSRGFPFPLLGLVHISNSFTRHRALTINETMDISCRFGELEPHDKGTAFTILTEVTVQGRKVWESSSTMLHRHPVAGGDKKAETAAADDMKDATRETWRIAGDMGRRYGKASGDNNPIHLWPLTARLFGFKRHIVHGMWTKSHALAQLAPKTGARPFTCAVAFKLPVFLPAQVSFLHRSDAAGIRFEVRDREAVKPHLKGYVQFLG
jgi:acyl dehydratase